ncbi:MAG: c-type cytochrome [Dehalococcoidia bacterium]|nr:c-type cytochrome [Dehalococcoidia bacterium]
MRKFPHRAITMLALIALTSLAAGCMGADAPTMRRHEAQMALAERSGMAAHIPAGGASAPGAPAAAPGKAAAGSDPVRLGQAVAGKYGCTACHSATGANGVGPTWKGLAGHEVALTNGQKLTADDAYLKESIENPNAKVHQGFAPSIMPQDFAKTMKAEEIDQVIAYIKSLR